MSPGGVARMVAGLIERLDLRDVTLVGNDTGGAICQIVISRASRAYRKARVDQLRRLREHSSPVLLRPTQYAARLFGTRFVDFLAWVLGARFAQRALFKTVAIRHIDEATLDAYAGRLRQDPDVRRDLAQITVRASPTGTR